MTTLTIGFDAETPARFRHAVAALPRSFVVGEPPAAVIIGGAPGWTDRARRHLDGGSRAVLVGDPVAEDAQALHLSAIDARALIMLAPAGAHATGLDVLRERVAASDGGLLECRVITSPSASRSAATIAMLELLRSVDSPMIRVSAASSDEHGFHATGGLESGRDVLLAADVCAAIAPVARLRVISSAGLVEADIPLAGRARPARVRSVLDSGEWHAEQAFVSPARAVLERFHSAITRSETGGDLEAFLRAVPHALRLGWT
jgi:hypothetical protein